MYEYHVLRVIVEKFPNARQHARSYIVEGLSLPHDVEVNVRDESEIFQSLPQHVRVLPCREDRYAEAGILPKLQYNRSHLDSFRPRACYACNVLHRYLSLEYNWIPPNNIATCSVNMMLTVRMFEPVSEINM